MSQNQLDRGQVDMKNYKWQNIAELFCCEFPSSPTDPYISLTIRSYIVPLFRSSARRGKLFASRPNLASSLVFGVGAQHSLTHIWQNSAARQTPNTSSAEKASERARDFGPLPVGLSLFHSFKRQLMQKKRCAPPVLEHFRLMVLRVSRLPTRALSLALF